MAGTVVAMPIAPAPKGVVEEVEMEKMGVRRVEVANEKTLARLFKRVEVA